MNWISRLLDLIPREKKPKGPRRRALCIGINNYPGSSNDLRGCVNDCKVWATEILRGIFKYERPTILKDSKATILRVTKEMTRLVMSAKPGDCITIQFSGHGTSVPDDNGDESDGRDEALCLYDGLLRDDDIRDILAKAAKGVKLTVITDACHSGTVTRGYVRDLDEGENKKIKYLPPEDDEFAKKTRSIKVTKKAFRPHSEVAMNEVLITGCKDTEYSYDANFKGRYYGAMTYNAWQVIKENPDVTYKQFHKKLRKRLPSNQYPQSPQLEGKKENTQEKMFV